MPDLSASALGVLHHYAHYMVASIEDLDLRVLESRGFLYVPGFASEDECTALADTWRRTNTSYVPVHRLPRAELGSSTLPAKYDELQRRIMRETSIQPDSPLDSGEFYYTHKDLPTAGENFGEGPFEGWHQDHDYWLRLERYHYLNFHLTIEKESPEDANFGLVPIDGAAQMMPEIPLAGGAARELAPSQLVKDVFGLPVPDWAAHVYVDQSDGRLFPIRDVTTLAEVPKLRAGDLIIFRGDVLHSRLPFSSYRLTMSMRTSASTSLVTASSLLNGVPRKWGTPIFVGWGSAVFAWMKVLRAPALTSGSITALQAAYHKGELASLRKTAHFLLRCKEPPESLSMFTVLSTNARFQTWRFLFRSYVYLRRHFLESFVENGPS